MILTDLSSFKKCKKKKSKNTIFINKKYININRKHVNIKCDKCGKKFIGYLLNWYYLKTHICISCRRKNRNHSEETKEKMRLTRSFFSKEKNEEINKKREKTNMILFGCKTPAENIKIKEKTKKYFEKTYGGNPNKLEKIKNKIRKTSKEKYGSEKAFKYGSKEFKNNMKEKYGSESAMKNKRISFKSNKLRIKTMLEKYGVESPFQIKDIIEKSKAKIRETKEKTGSFIPLSQKTEFEIYKMKVRQLTRKIQNKVYNSWKGYDYYDKEYIKDNFSLSKTDKKRPSIDHKISISYGFDNNVPPEKIADIKNLCITKRCLNSQKGQKIEKQYKKHINNSKEKTNGR